MGALNSTHQAFVPRVVMMSRGTARQHGLKHFYSGYACVRGHLTNRYVSDGACIACKEMQAKARQEQETAAPRRRELDNLRYAKAPEKYREASRRRAQTEEYQKALQEWKSRNPGYVKKWRDANLEDQRAKIKARRVAKPEVYAAQGSRRRALKRGADGSFTAADVLRIRGEQNDCCVYCAVDLRGRGHVDHRMPLSRGGSNWPNNIQILCAPCNLSKKDKDPAEFARSRGLAA